MIFCSQDLLFENLKVVNLVIAAPFLIDEDFEKLDLHFSQISFAVIVSVKR